ncbi:MAG: N-acetylglucosaminyldiphosphoundecaprenol N-acetyl-beta-D-mannosaminyltransferase [Clostridiales bacterium]|jgi:N-acetylglucosaminyldiphosphoundecaprenol N-acetyl-beta-D-mannosaminyltransferase|nr:N-acetylglucosaminyldiphosphoundecaprenol N-acetyl-beta-D-mannosaminyltransferase [Clostridiales bacterium]MDN5297521.1 N-acetylglucosaminyldiphosphoundecaprenol N-acetyl-beta-D-mannosaminyltransferase [Clostridiales bacterium]
MNHIRGKTTVKILGVKFDKLDFDEAYQRFTTFMMQDETKMIFTPNSELVMMAQEDEAFRQILNEGDLTVPDGIGIILASRIHNLELTERIPGIDLMAKMLAYANRSNKSIFLFGAKPGVAEKAAQNIAEQYGNIKIVGVQDGYFDEREELRILDRINEVKPDILFTALGAPKQEKWIYKYRKLLNVKVAMGVGGSIDVWAGTAKRAPKIFQKMGLEWFYRLLKEPTRIGRMMLLPKFLIKVIFTKAQASDE